MLFCWLVRQLGVKHFVKDFLNTYCFIHSFILKLRKGASWKHFAARNRGIISDSLTIKNNTFSYSKSLTWVRWRRHFDEAVY